MNHKDSQNVNEPEKKSHTAFERQLQTLAPKATETSEAEAMYACGFQAGRQSALGEMSTTHSSQSAAAWRPLMLAACISCLLVGPIGYWLGQFHSPAGERLVVAGDSVREPIPVPANDSQPTPPSLEIPVNAVESQPQPGANEQFAALDLSHFWETLAIFSGYQSPAGSAPQQYLTTRSASDIHSVLDQLNIVSTRNVPANVAEGLSGAGGSPVENNAVTKSSKISPRRQLRHLDGFRTPLTNRESTTDLMQWFD
ncbi:hypothetical protein SH139x_004110 [Planctomycetaceae bacterium SH139]